MNDMMKTILDGMEVGFAEMKADVGEMKTDIGEMKTNIGEMRTDIDEMKTDIGEMKTIIGEMKSGFIKLHTKLDRIDNRIEFLVDHNEQHFRTRGPSQPPRGSACWNRSVPSKLNATGRQSRTKSRT